MQEPATHSMNKKDSIIRAVIYARISDRKQLDGASLETQVSNCTEYALSKNWHVIKSFQEVHTGMEYRERKLLSQVREMVRDGEVDIVLVNSLDRLARDMIHQAVLLDEMQHYNTILESVTEDIDNSPLGQFMRQALGFAAAVEREKFLERSKRTIDKKVREGKLVGSGVANYGYMYDEDHTCYLVNSVEAAIVQRIYKMRLDGIACKRIAILLNEEGVPSRRGKWGTSSIFNILTSPVYHGKAQAYRVKFVRQNGKRVRTDATNPVDLPDGVIPAIISKETFDAVQSVLARAKIEASRNNRDPQQALLRNGYIKCGYCNHSLVAIGRSGEVVNQKTGEVYYKKTYYMCNKARIVPKTCTGVTMTAENIDNIVWEYIGSLLEDLSGIQYALELLKSKQKQEFDVAAIERSINNAKKEQEQLAEDMIGLRGNARALLLAQINKLEERIAELEDEKKQAIPHATQLEKQQQEIDHFLEWVEEMKGRYHEATYEEKRVALRVLGITVLLYKESDREHLRYEIRVGLTQLFPDLARDWEFSG